jgi:hypothetical protein
MTDYVAVLSAEYPGREWSITDNDYDTLVIHDDGPKPTKKTLDDAWPQVQYDREHAQVEQDRHAAYITDADPLFFKWQRGSGSEQAWRDAVQAVKDAYPYPEPV